MKKVLHVVGARPNFMKLGPVYDALRSYGEITQLIVHTGQHYDHNMSDVFFEELNLPAPEYNLEISGGSALNQIGHGILKMEEVLDKGKPDLVCIYGDVNATAFTSIVASKLGIPLAHMEAGLRSFDNSMPEETNRIIADGLSSYFFTPSVDANVNLINEGKKERDIFFVGNLMIDTLVRFMPSIESTSITFEIPKKYALVTLHRPSNVDNMEKLVSLLNYLVEVGEQSKVIFPLHPRTRERLGNRINDFSKNIVFVKPLGYFEFIKLQKHAHYILTDSGGVQEESTYLGVPCFTFRDNTERPVTVTEGTNTLVGSNVEKLKIALNQFLDGDVKRGKIPSLWDGRAAFRTAEKIAEILN